MTPLIRDNCFRISGPQLKMMLLAGARYLEANAAEVNNLNVFPVPDGDTGTNMTLTMSGVVASLTELTEDSNLGQVADLISDAALLAARGNSGVILSQFLRGLARSLKQKDSASSQEMARAFQYGLVYAYQAVTSPVAGTILTVARDIARGCRRLVSDNAHLTEILHHALTVGQQALALTPTQLPVLKEAGVVDAGGQGLLVFLEGCLAGLEGNEPERLQARTFPTRKLPAATKAVQELLYQYCTEALVKYHAAPDVAALRIQLQPLGDSLLLVEGKQLLKMHLHTNHPGEALELLLKHGTLHDIKIDNMAEQHSQTIKPLLPLAVVAVSPGKGFDETFRSLGVSITVPGGDTMNPSVQDLLQAIEATGALQVFLLPNNSNIRLAAEQAATIIESSVKIVPTENVVQGLAAMLKFNPGLDPEENYDNMLSASRSVNWGRLTFAARASSWQERSLKQGDFLGFSQGELLIVAQDLTKATEMLVEKLMEENCELLTLFYGENVSCQLAVSIASEIEQRFPDLEVELQYGGQPADYFFLMLE